MLPVFEQNNGLLFYPVQYEGLESSLTFLYGRHNQSANRAFGVLALENRGKNVPARLRLCVPKNGQQDH